MSLNQTHNRNSTTPLGTIVQSKNTTGTALTTGVADNFSNSISLNQGTYNWYCEYILRANTADATGVSMSYQITNLGTNNGSVINTMTTGVNAYVFDTLPVTNLESFGIGGVFQVGLDGFVPNFTATVSFAGGTVTRFYNLYITKIA